jgi:hypothetical protein
MNDQFRNIVNDVMRDNVNSARDRATWESASAIERATFGKIFGAIEAVVGLIGVFGCFLISSATENARLLTYICGILWVIPFIAAFALIGRFRHSMFVRLRNIIATFVGGR